MEHILTAFCAGQVRGQGSLNYYGLRANGTAIIRGSDEQYAWRDQVRDTVKMSLPQDYQTILREVPVAVNFTFIYARPKNHYRTNGDLKDWAEQIYFCLTGIDIDKSERLVNDALTESGIITDDKQIVMARTEKIYVNSEHSVPGIHMEIWRLD